MFSSCENKMRKKQTGVNRMSVASRVQRHHTIEEKQKSPSPTGNVFGLKVPSEKIIENNIQRFSLVIDLDATFVHTLVDMIHYSRTIKLVESIDDKIVKDDLMSRIITFTLQNCRMWTILRPGTMEFIEFARYYFKDILVWSAGEKSYVEQIVSIIFPPHISKSAIIFHRDDCVPDDEIDCGDKIASPSTGDRRCLTKPLDRIFELNSEINHSNTFILDDRSDIASMNIDNLIQITPFEPKLNLQGITHSDNAFEKLTAWLLREDVLTAPDVRNLDKSNIF